MRMGSPSDTALISRATSSSPPSNPDAQAAAFQQSVHEARQARFAADGNPAQQRGDEIPYAAQPGDSVSSIAGAHHQSLSAMLADNAQLRNPNLIQRNQIVFLPNPSPAEKQTYNDLQQAYQADQSVAADKKPTRDPALRKLNAADLPDATTAAADAWGKLKSDLQKELTNAVGTDAAYPEDKAQSLVAQMRDRAAQDSNYQDAVTEAYDAAKAQWSSEGRTHDKLDPLDQRLQALHEAEQGARLMHGRDPDAINAVAAARADLVNTIQSQLQHGAGNGSPAAREAAIAKTALQMDTFGPQDADFSSAVDHAAYNLTVQPGVDAVARAYQSGGAKAAAQALVQQVQSVSPETAARILAGSQSTVNKIAADLGKEANDLSFSLSPSPLYQSSIGEGKKFNQTYSDLAKSVDLASRAPGGQVLVRQVADAVAAKIPPVPTRYQPSGQSEPGVQVYANAATSGIGNGNPAGFSAAIAGSLQQAGRQGEASHMLGAMGRGLDQFRDKVVSDVQAYGNAAAPINSLIKNWSGVLTPQQVSSATAKYLAANPSIVKSINSTRSTLDQDGYAIVRDNMELAQLDPALKRIDGYQSYDASRAGITDRTPQATVAVALSQKAHAEVARAVLQSAAMGVKGSAAISLDNVNMLKNDRQFVKQLGNSILSQSVGPSVNMGKFPIDPRRLTPFGAGVNIAGAALNGLATWRSLQNLSQGGASPLNDLKTVYNAVGFGKESTEFGALAATYLAQRAGATLPTDVSAVLSRQGPWANFNAAFNLTGGALDSATAIQDLLDHKDGQAASSFVSAGGNFALGLRAAQDAGLIGDDVIGSAIIGAEWLGPVAGAAVALGATGVAFFDQLQANDKWKSSNSDFLVDAGLRPEIAHAIADQEPDLGSPGPVLKALASYLGTTPSDIVNYLNRQNPDTVNGFIGSALIVPQNKDGSFPETAANDVTAGSSNYLGSQPLSETLPPALNYAPESLRALALLAENHFQDFPGRHISYGA